MKYYGPFDPHVVCAPGVGLVHLHRWWGGDPECMNCGAQLDENGMSHLGQWVATGWTWIIHEQDAIPERVAR